MSGAPLANVLETTVHSTGFAALLARINGHKKKFSPGNLKRAALAGAEEAEKLIVNEMQNEPKHGERYPYPWMPNVASREGTDDMPQVQLGELVSRFDTGNLPSSPSVGKASLENRSKHAIWMEFGWTDRGGNLLSRPFMRTGVARYKDQIIDAMNAEIK